MVEVHEQNRGQTRAVTVKDSSVGDQQNLPKLSAHAGCLPANDSAKATEFPPGDLTDVRSVLGIPVCSSSGRGCLFCFVSLFLQASLFLLIPEVVGDATLVKAAQGQGLA